MNVSIDTLQLLSYHNDVAAKSALARMLVLKATGKGESLCAWLNKTVDCFVVCPNNPLIKSTSHHHGI
jgi:hypothetical protein